MARVALALLLDRAMDGVSLAPGLQVEVLHVEQLPGAAVRVRPCSCSNGNTGAWEKRLWRRASAGVWCCGTGRGGAAPVLGAGERRH